MKLYISPISVTTLALFYLPIVLWLLWRIARAPRLGRNAKYVAIPTVVVVAYVIVMGDVTMNSLAMSRVCERAGLHIYNKVKVEGYFDTRSGPDEIKRYGYKFIETQRPGGKVARYERQPDGSTTRIEQNEVTAEYEVVYEDKSPVPELGVGSMRRSFVRNRQSGEVIGEWLSFSPMHGWVDRFTLNRWFGVGLQGCSGDRGNASRFPIEILPTKQQSDSNKENSNGES